MRLCISNRKKLRNTKKSLCKCSSWNYGALGSIWVGVWGLGFVWVVLKYDKNRHQEKVVMGYIDIATSVLFVLLRASQGCVMFFFVVFIVGTLIHFTLCAIHFSAIRCRSGCEFVDPSASPRFSSFEVDVARCPGSIQSRRFSPSWFFGPRVGERSNASPRIAGNPCRVGGAPDVASCLRRHPLRFFPAPWVVRRMRSSSSVVVGRRGSFRSL